MVKPFVRHSSRVVLETPIFRLRQDRAEHPRTGHQGDYVVLDGPDWVNVIALTDEDDLVLVRQWRHGVARVELELPAGMVEPGESPVDAAARELREETGYEPREVRVLGEVRPNTAFQSNTCYTVVALGCRLTSAQSFDPGEDIEVERVPLARLESLVSDGTLQSAMVICAVFWWLRERGGLDWSR